MVDFNKAIEEVQKPLPPMKPWPPGTIVTGFNRRGLFLPTFHKGHLFMTFTGRKANQLTNSGWIQSARCLICNEMIQGVDAEFWEVKATKTDIRRCYNKAENDVRRLMTAMKHLREVGQL